MRKTVALVLLIPLIIAPAFSLTCSDGISGVVCTSDNWQTLITHLQNVFSGVVSSVLGWGRTNKSCLTTANATDNGIFYVDTGNAHGDLSGQPLVWASHISSTITCTATSRSKVLTVCTPGLGGLQVGNGVMLPGAGPGVAFNRATAAVTVAHNGSATGSNTYRYLLITLDELQGMGGAVGVGTASVTSAPALSTLGQNASGGWYCFSDSSYSTSSGPVLYGMYRSYNGGSYQLIFVDNSVDGTCDFGQTLANGRGWPLTLPNGTSFAGQNEAVFSYVTAATSTTMTLNDAPWVSGRVTVTGDDAMAAYLTSQIATQAGSGKILFGPHTYNVQRPMFWNGSSWSWSISGATGVYPMKVPTDSSNLSFAGSSRETTTIVTGPDMYTYGGLFGFGVDLTRPWNLIYYATSTINQGDTQVCLSTPSNTSNFAVGDDAWLFAGQQTTSGCPASGGTPGANCHWSESNSIIAINSASGCMTLKYPANKAYFLDSNGNPFGIVDMPKGAVSIHEISLHDMTVNSYSPITVEGPTFNESLYNINAPLGLSAGWSYGREGRGYSVHDNTLTIGDGTGAFHTEQEIDEDAGVQIDNNTLVFMVAPNNAGTYGVFGVAATEGTSDFTFSHNHVFNGNAFSDCESNNIKIVDNDFVNGFVGLGRTIAGGCPVEFTPDNWIVSGNTFYGSGIGNRATVELANVVSAAVVSANTVNGKVGDSANACFKVSSGTVSGNACNTNTVGNYTAGIEITPQPAGSTSIPAMPIVTSGNVVFGASGQHSNGIVIDDPGRTWSGLIALTGDVLSPTGTGITVSSTSHVPNVKISSTEQISASTAFNPSSLANFVLPTGGNAMTAGLTEYADSNGDLFNACKGDVTLSSGTGTFSNACVTSASACQSKDITTPANACTVAAPGKGTVAITGTGTDHCRTWCE